MHRVTIYLDDVEHDTVLVPHPTTQEQLLKDWPRLTGYKVDGGPLIVVDNPPPYWVRIAWSKLKEPETTYVFASKAELDAFLKGADAACGWMEGVVTDCGYRHAVGWNLGA